MKLNYFIEGLGSVFNLNFNKKIGDYFSYYSAKTPKQQDTRALTQDWSIVGKDISNLINPQEEFNNGI